LRTERRNFLATLLAGAGLALAPLLASAQAGGATYETPMLDPWVPPEVREKAMAMPAPATEGEQLRAQVRAKLKRRFDAAAGPAGTLTREQARSAGLGAIADRFDAIDRSGRGIVRFEDYERFLELRR
jgi:hypothetical protein